MDYDAFFFDFDGVLADSVEVKTQAFAKLYEEFGSGVVDKVVDYHRNNSGVTRLEKFCYYQGELLGGELDDAELEELCQSFSRLVVDKVVAAPEIPGATELLEACRSNILCFVISATPDDELIEIVRRRGIHSFFVEILGSSETKTNNLKTLLKKYNLDPGRCLFFGDAESDYRAAQACKVNFLGILPGPDVPLLKLSPDVRWAKNFLDISSLL